MFRTQFSLVAFKCTHWHGDQKFDYHIAGNIVITKSGANPTHGSLATSAIGRHTRVRGDLQPATQHASLMCGDLQPATRHHAPYSFQGLLSRQQKEVPPRNKTKPPDHRRGSKSSRCFPPRTKTPPSSQKTEDVARAVFRRCTAPEGFSRAEHPAAIRCRPSRH